MNNPTEPPAPPIEISLASQLRRVIESILPGLYAYRYSQDPPPADADTQLILVDGAIATALMALANHDFPMMVASNHHLSSLNLNPQSSPAPPPAEPGAPETEDELRDLTHGEAPNKDPLDEYWGPLDRAIEDTYTSSPLSARDLNELETQDNSDHHSHPSEK